jgi:HAD superfamily hydrolase (TIGR01490 family)
VTVGTVEAGKFTAIAYRECAVVWQTLTMTTSPHTVAAFDLDGTLTEGGSVVKWLRHVGRAGSVTPALARHAPELLWGALRSGPSADEAKEKLFRAVLKGQSLDHVERRSADFATTHLATDPRQHVIQRLRWHLDNGHHVVVVSASPEIYVKLIASELGAHHAIGTRLAVDPRGVLTGGYLGRNCRGAEKSRRLAEWIEQQAFTERPEIYAYGNSRGDRRLLSAADHPFDVGKLGRLGALRAYPRLSAD